MKVNELRIGNWVKWKWRRPQRKPLIRFNCKEERVLNAEIMELIELLRAFH